jgi:hypothetical protein
MSLGDHNPLTPKRSQKELNRRAKQYFIELFDKGWMANVAYDQVSAWFGKTAADYAYKSVLGSYR